VELHGNGPVADDPEAAAPIVCTESGGGTFDDRAFLAGVDYGIAVATLRELRPESWAFAVDPDMVLQYDLLAMSLGYQTAVDHAADDSAALVTFVRRVASSRPMRDGPNDPSI
jgi:hypothetical protein